MQDNCRRTESENRAAKAPKKRRGVKTAGTLPVELAPGKVVEFTVVRSDRKTLAIELGRTGPKLRLPLRVSENYAVQFVKSRANWVLSHLERLEQAGAARPDDFHPVDGYHDGNHPDRSHPDTGHPVDFHPDSGDHGAGHPGIDRPGAETCGGAGKALTIEELEDLKRRARAVIPGRAAYYAPQLGVQPARITIKAQRTRWGSCSKAGNLNFNCLLMLTPPEVLDSVVVHELCHLLEMNHSKRFYAHLLRVFPRYKECRKWLNANGGRLLESLPRSE